MACLDLERTDIQRLISKAHHFGQLSKDVQNYIKYKIIKMS